MILIGDGPSASAAPHDDWFRRDAEFSGPWTGRERWREWFADEAGDDMDDETIREHLENDA